MGNEEIAYVLVFIRNEEDSNGLEKKQMPAHLIWNGKSSFSSISKYQEANARMLRFDAVRRRLLLYHRTDHIASLQVKGMSTRKGTVKFLE
jgi:hypothetical protein